MCDDSITMIHTYLGYSTVGFVRVVGARHSYLHTRVSWAFPPISVQGAWGLGGGGGIHILYCTCIYIYPPPKKKKKKTPGGSTLHNICSILYYCTYSSRVYRVYIYIYTYMLPFLETKRNKVGMMSFPPPPNKKQVFFFF